ncbi:hypothetical protein CAI22_15960 [Acinetobacter johnsonii]|nr:hypothetical protein [Acinetobacter johnsonii]
MKTMKQLLPTQLDPYDRQKIGASSPKIRHNQLDKLHQSSRSYLNSLIMHGANFYQNAALRGYVLAEQIEFFIAELDLVIRYFQIHHLNFMLKCIED